MDGYALNIKDLQTERNIQVEGESKAGSPAPKLKPHTAMKIFTGAIVPISANIVIKRKIPSKETPQFSFELMREVIQRS